MRVGSSSVVFFLTISKSLKVAVSENSQVDLKNNDFGCEVNKMERRNYWFNKSDRSLAKGFERTLW